LLEYYFREQRGKIKSYHISETEIENAMKSGRLTFLFDKDGRFFETSDAQPPENAPRSEQS